MFEIFTEKMRLSLDELVSQFDGIDPQWQADPLTLGALRQCMRDVLDAMRTEGHPEDVKALKVIYEGLQTMVHMMERISAGI